MNAASNRARETRDDLDLEGGFSWLLPWLTRIGHLEGGALQASPGGQGMVPAEAQRRALTSAALQLSAGLMRQCFDDSPISVAVFDPAGRLIQVNAAFCTLLGCAADALVERNIEELMHPDDVPALQERRRWLLDGVCSGFEVETRFAPANRPQVWTRVSGRLERYGGGCPPHIFAHIVEFSEPPPGPQNPRRQAEEMVLQNWDPERYL